MQQASQVPQTAQVQEEQPIGMGNNSRQSDSPGRGSRAAGSEEGSHTMVNTTSSANAVSLLASQIPEFSGAEEENVRLWIQRVEKVSQIHRSAKDVTLLAASSKLTKIARKWYDLGTGPMLESWPRFREAILKRFERKILFHVAMQKAEARRWNTIKETFHEYAMEKLALVYRMDLPERDIIHLLINGISSRSLRATASALKVESVDEFLEEMHRITAAVAKPERKHINGVKADKNRDLQCKTCGKKGHTAKQYRSADVVCFFCKTPGYRKPECPKLKKRDVPGSTAVEVSTASTSTDTEQVVTVQEPARNLKISNLPVM